LAVLVGIATSRGLRFELDGGAVLGRNATCGIVLADPLVSSRHAEIRRDADGRYRIADLGATHGIYLNGAKVEEAVLVDGDEVIMGATRMRFEDRDPPPAEARGPSAVVADQPHVVSHRLPHQGRAFPPAKDLALAEPSRTAYERLRIAYEVGRALAAARDLDELLRQVLDRAFELLPGANRGAILLGSPLVPRVAVRRDGDAGSLVISRSILHEVVSQRVGLISVDASADRRFGRAPSLAAGGVRSALSVPMIHGEDLVGVIYVDAPTAGLFDELDLDVMATIAGQAALAVLTARMRATIEAQARLAAVGQVAAGLAHDFANSMTAVTFGADQIANARDASATDKSAAQMITTAADHAIVLTRKLAALARGGGSDPRVLDLSAFVDEAAALVRRMLGSQISVVAQHASEPVAILIDKVELEQVVLNLSFNARDAMGGAGQITLGAGVDPATGRAALTVTDTGGGMPPEVVARAFEPFFTTKAAGRGSGIGLAIVHRVVTGSNGTIAISSNVGQGTEFRMTWPRARGEVGTAAALAPATRAGERVLVVDGDQAVRKVMTRILAATGYAATSAARGDEALKVLAATPYAALVVDAMLSGAVSGRQLAERARAAQPGLRVLYVSGFTEAAEVEELTASGAMLLAKPFGPRELSGKLDALLATSRPAPRPGLLARFASRRELLARYDAVTHSLEVTTSLRPSDEDGPVNVVIRFDDTAREIRTRARVIQHLADGVRVALTDENAIELVTSTATETAPAFRRAEPRQLACIMVRLATSSGLELVTHTQDISAGGVMLSTDHDLPLGTVVNLSLAFPDRAEPISVAGKIRSAVRTGPGRGVGIELQPASPAQREELAAAVAALAGL
jgi:signal transduction histidine kinase/DNA-binding response OmpR family regulator